MIIIISTCILLLLLLLITMALLRAIKKLQLFEDIFSDVVLEIRRYDQFIKFVYDKKLLYDSSELTKINSGWEFLHLELERSIMRLDLIVEGEIIEDGEEEN